MSRPTVLVTLLAAVVAPLAVAGCQPDTGQPASLNPPPGYSAPTSHPEVPPGLSMIHAGILNQLRIDDRLHDDGYEPDRWAFTDSDRDGCRDDYQAEAGDAERVDTWHPTIACKAATGLWVSVYDGARHADAAELQVDHVVARKDAYSAGGYAWSDTEVDRFVGWQPNLQAVTGGVNSSKGERGPDRWPYAGRDGVLLARRSDVPMAAGGACWYASTYAATKIEFRLSVTTAQWVALGRLFGTCTP